MIPGTKKEEWLAAALYGELTVEERAQFEALLAKDARLREEFSQLQSLCAAIPVHEIPFQGDLTGAVMEELRRGPAPRFRFNWSHLGFAGMALLVIGAVAVQFMPQTVVEVTPGAVAAVDLNGQTQNALAQSAEEAAKGNFSTAREILESGLQNEHDPAEQGRFQLALADLEYGHGERYAEAHAAYEALREKHFDLFSSDPVTVQRFEVLSECASLGFGPLYALDAARNGVTDPLPALENLVATHPEKKIAILAILAMEETVQSELPEAHSHVAALQAVRERCANANARARLDLALGEAHWSESRDKAQAEKAFQQAIAGGNPTIVRLAQEKMAALQ
ncbi:MAG: hypothetical protein HYV27_20465 [Candidatus Hydrogenedentes bacterium]|nr:hypothetical protein [Candidatus Hydrogenedentota bacterium]